MPQRVGTMAFTDEGRMYEQTARNRDLRLVPSPAARAEADSRVAVLLNANARRVTGKVLKSLSHVVPDEDLFLSRSSLDARRIAQAVLDRRYHTVFCGGGDGTFMAFVNHVLAELELRNQHHYQRPPRFGVLRLGTGNALANLVNASHHRGDGVLDDVLRARAGEVPGYRRVELFRVDGKRTMFAGVGIDGQIINDYNAVRESLGQGAFRGLIAGGGGYVASVALRTIPFYVTHSARYDCELINGRGVAYRMGPDGNPVAEYQPGELIFRGAVRLAAAGTMPFYGFGMRAFPFAGQRRGMMHLRLCWSSTAEILAHLPSLWAGRYFTRTMGEFLVSEATLRFDSAMPLEVAGDACGYQSELHLEMCPEQVELVDYTGSVH
ncbi:MAG TPA: diacylglycerol kinase family protein [Myxococcales bacterium]|nr:diacylglycerol kinase family protein [Myxococcales bacterium]